MKLRLRFSDKTIAIPCFLIRNDEDNAQPFIGVSFCDIQEHLKDGDCFEINAPWEVSNDSNSKG